MTRLRAFVLAAIGCVIGGCADLEAIELDRCGNGVLEPARGEDCDGYAIEPSTRCAALGEAHECRYVCAEPGKVVGCPTGWRCGIDGVCRAAAGTLAAEAQPVNQPAGFWMELADMDGDFQADIITVDGEHAVAAYLEGADLRQSFEIPIATFGQPILAEASGDGLPDLLLPTFAGLSTLRGSPDRRLLPTSYASFPLDVFDARFFSMDLLPDVIVALGSSASFAGEELMAITPNRIAGVGFNWSAGAMGSYDLAKLLPPAVGDIDEMREASSPLLPAGSETPHEIALAFKDETRITVLRPTLGIDLETQSLSVTLDSEPAEVTLDSPVAGGLLAVQLNPPAEPSGESALRCSPTTRVPGDTHLDLLVSIADPNRPPVVVAAFGLGDGRFHSLPCELDAVVASTIAADQRAAPIDWLVCLEPLLAAGQLDDDGVLDVVARQGLWLTGLLANPFVGVCDTEAPHVSQLDLSWTVARIADLDGRPPSDVVAARTEAGLDVLLGSHDAPHTMSHVPTLAAVSELAIADVDANGAEDVAFIERFGAGDDALSLLFGELYAAPSPPVTLSSSGEMITLGTFDMTRIGDIVPDDASEIALVTRNGGALDVALLWGRSDRQIHAPFLMFYPDGASVPLSGAVGQFEIDGNPATSERALVALGGIGETKEVALGAGVIEGESHIALVLERLPLPGDGSEAGVGMLAIDHDEDGHDSVALLVYGTPTAFRSRLFFPNIGPTDWSLPPELTLDAALPLGVPSDPALGLLSAWSTHMHPSARICRFGDQATPALVVLMLEQTPCASGEGNTANSAAYVFDAALLSSIAAGSGGTPVKLAAPPGETMLAIDCLQADADIAEELVVLTITPPPPACEETLEAFSSLKIYLTDVDGSGLVAPAAELDAAALPALGSATHARPPVNGTATGDVNGDGIDDVAIAAGVRTLILLGNAVNP